MTNERLAELRRNTTPGPWVAGRADVATVEHGVDSKWVYAASGFHVALASGLATQSWDETMANARLIAAAPDLLDTVDALNAERRWIPCSERLPERHQVVAFVICDRRGEYHGRVLGGTFQGTELGYPEFSTPGVAWWGSHWMPLPESPVATSEEGS